PGLTELGIAETPVTPESKDDSNPIPPLTEVITERAAGRVRLDRIGERVQSDPRLLGELAGHGVVPGAEADVARTAERFVLPGSTGGEVAIPAASARQPDVTPQTHGQK